MSRPREWVLMSPRFTQTIGDVNQDIRMAIHQENIGAHISGEYELLVPKKAYDKTVDVLKDMVTPLRALLEVHGKDFEINIVFSEHLDIVEGTLKELGEIV